MNFKNGYKFYDTNHNLLNIIGCFDCDVCKEWKDQPWKVRIFSPVHCYNCHYAGYDDEYTIYYSNKKENKNAGIGLFLCLKCNKKIKLLKNPRNLHLREIGFNLNHY